MGKFDSRKRELPFFSGQRESCCGEGGGAFLGNIRHSKRE